MQQSRILPTIISFFLIVSTVFTGNLFAQTVTLTTPVRQANGTVKITLTGSSASSVVLQGSSDCKSWTDIQTFTLSGTAQTYLDTPTAQKRWKFFRIKPSTPVALPDLGQYANAVFPAAEGFDTVQFARNGNLGFIFWKDRDLRIRERSASGWTEQLVTSGGNLFQLNSTRQDYKFQPAAILLYDSNSNPNVFRLNGDKTIAHFVRVGSTWTRVATITASPANNNLSLLVGTVGPNNVFHLAAISAGDTPNISHGSNLSGQWTWSKVTDIGGLPRFYLPPSYASRWFSLAVDSRNAAHLVFRPAFTLSYHAEGYVRAYNELNYANNKSGQWSIRTIQKPADISGEAGNGASIAIGPGDKPYIAAWYNERGDGGSSQWSRLHFHQQDVNGNWSSSLVLSRPESNYVAGDGEKGTGFAPYLRFDSRGRAHILFSDHASEHFWSAGQIEYAGQIRHAWWNGSQWQFETVFRQTTPLQHQMVYPAFAMSGTELAVIGLQRFTQWNMGVYPPVVNSTYRFSFTTRPLL